MVTLYVILQVIANVTLAKSAAAIGAAITAFAAAIGIGRIGSSALEGTSRQPEAANDIRTTMIISAALIEGVTFFAVVVCLLIVLT